MALNDTAIRLAAVALRIGDSFMVDATLNDITLTAYDPATDTNTQTTVQYPTRGLLYEISDFEKTTLYPKFPEVTAEKRKFLYASTNVSLAYTPSTSDFVTIDGEKWEIWKTVTPPGRSIYILYVAKAS